MQVFAHDGEAGFDGVWTGITSAKGFNSILIDPPAEGTHWVRYTTGATAALTIGETLTGGTSDATCTLIGQAVETGTAGSGDVGIIIVKAPSGAFQAETLTGALSTGTVAIIQDFIPILTLAHPKAALITAETAAINFSFSGTIPTLTAGTNHTHQMAASQSYVVRGYKNIRKFMAINAANGNNAVIKYTLFF